MPENHFAAALPTSRGKISVIGDRQLSCGAFDDLASPYRSSIETCRGSISPLVIVGANLLPGPYQHHASYFGILNYYLCEVLAHRFVGK